MANPFDQFDDAVLDLQQAPKNPFDQFDSVDLPDDGLVASHDTSLKSSHEPTGTQPQQSTFDRTMRESARVLSPVVRPVLEFGGMAGGSAIGTAAGAEMGPGAIATGIAGAGLGYAAGKQVADRWDEYAGTKEPPQSVKDAYIEAGKDIVTGAALEGGGQVVGLAFKPIYQGGKWVFKKIGETAAGAGIGGAAGYAVGGKEGAVEGAAIGAAAGLGAKYVPKAIAEKAGRTLAAAIDDAGSAIYAKNAEEAAGIEKLINTGAPKNGPKFKFSLAQKSDNPATIMLERTQTHGGSETAARLYREQAAENNAALRGYYERNFPGEHGVDDLIGELKTQQGALKEGEQAASKAVVEKAEAIPMSEPSVSGENIADELRAAKTATKQRVNESYSKVADNEVDISGMLQDFDNISRPMSKFEDPGNVPDILGRVKDIIGDSKSATVSDLQGLRSELIGQSRKIKGSGEPNERLTSRLDRAARSVEEAIAKAGESAPQLKEANRFFRENYAEVFKQRTVGDILRKGPRGELTRIPPEKIPDKLWSDKTGSAIKNVEKAIGKEKTADIIRDHAAYDMINTPGMFDADGKIVGRRLNSWIGKNRRLLNKVGIQGEFEGVAQAQRVADMAKESVAEFERSAAGSILGVDPESAIANALKNRRVGRAAHELMGKVKGNRAAEAGLQKAFADHIISVAETTATDVAGSKIISNASLSRNIKKFMPAMRVIYRDAPDKFKAIRTIQRAYEISVRTAKSPIGGGSDTKELFSTALGKIMHIGHKAPGVKILYDYLKNQSDKKANELISRALFDSDLAETLISAYNKTITPKEFAKVADGKIIDLAKYRGSKTARAASAAIGVGVNEDDNR